MTTPHQDLETIITKRNCLLTEETLDLEEDELPREKCLLTEETLDLEEDDLNANSEYSLTLLAKVASLKKINTKAVYSVLFKAWNPSKGMKIQNLDENIFCITFNHEWDRKRILDSWPWSVISSHLVVRDWPLHLALRDIDFNLSPFWIRICGLPPNQMTKPNAEKIANKIGVLKEIDFTANGKISWFKYLRIRVEIDIQKPLHTGFNGNKEPHKKAWVHL
ncbi:hypothetical protein RJ639_021300 [Escallonia herrerae]|uniref:DUF4283 domain-containing protein n=1 Tax=Escallonia herrerae TaxID=1293975 RepID=A0AA89AHE5_9ASTE|nr:hypothetical protein RJ639_021300 [Escallonia herrerae]